MEMSDLASLAPFNPMKKLLTIALLTVALAGCSAEKPNHNFKIGDRVVHVLAEDGIKGVVIGLSEFNGDLVRVRFSPYSEAGYCVYGELKLVERPTQPEAARQ